MDKDMESETIQNLTRQIEFLQGKVSTLETALATNTANYTNLDRRLGEIFTAIQDLTRSMNRLSEDKASAAVQLEHTKQIQSLINWRFWMIGIAAALSAVFPTALYIFNNLHK